MLQPKRTKFRKQFKGRNRGLAMTGNKVSFGEYGLKAMERGRITARQIEAARRAGLPARRRPIRGGTDGARLTFRGLPCPNIFTGGHNFHSRLEFNSRRSLEKTTETLVHLARLVADAHRG